MTRQHGYERRSTQLHAPSRPFCHHELSWDILWCKAVCVKCGDHFIEREQLPEKEPRSAHRTAELVARHQAETAALPMNPPQEVILEHARRQALELLRHAYQLERDLDCAWENNQIINKAYCELDVATRELRGLSFATKESR